MFDFCQTCYVLQIDMDMEDGDADEDASKPQERKYGKIIESHAADYGVDGTHSVEFGYYSS